MLKKGLCRDINHQAGLYLFTITASLFLKTSLLHLFLLSKRRRTFPCRLLHIQQEDWLVNSQGLFNMAATAELCQLSTIAVPSALSRRRTNRFKTTSALMKRPCLLCCCHTKPDFEPNANHVAASRPSRFIREGAERRTFDGSAK